jgi:hypothetical protein
MKTVAEGSPEVFNLQQIFRRLSRIVVIQQLIFLNKIVKHLSIADFS